MVKYKNLCRHDKILPVVCLLLSTLRLCESAADGFFEDADQSNDFLSSSASPYQNFDLRHTIPGEPHIDYPIYSTVPKTNFACAGKHEGYYADTETRCQAFRICTHTATSEQGFGFLCPNGTLFSQKNFVCDWYRNVNCEESEQYYSKNNANRIGSKRDMMETVRQMMEYPMKTISKALQRGTANSQRPTYNGFNTLNVGDDSAVSTRNAPTNAPKIEPTNAPATKTDFNNGQKTAVTRAQVESLSKYGSEVLKENEQAAKPQTPIIPSNPPTQVEDEFSIDLRSGADALGEEAVPVDVYVNSLGELSTDPGVKFDKKQSRIIALGPQDREQKLNFAQTINVALNSLSDDLLPTTAAIAPDYVKRLRSTDEGTVTNLANNINDLQTKLANGNQVRTPPTKHAIRFLSRGFSAQEEDGKRTTAPYLYNRPKQTPSTIRFTPNALTSVPLKSYSYDDSKSKLHKAINTLEVLSEEAVIPETVSFSPLTTTPTKRLQISEDSDYLTEAASSASPDDGSYLSPPILEIPEVNDVAAFEPIRVAQEEANYTDSDSKKNISDQVDTVTEELLTPSKNTEIDGEKISANRHATNLLLAGLKLSILDAQLNNNELPADEISTPKKPTIKRVAATREKLVATTSRMTTTEAPPTTKAYRIPTTTSAMSTSTETVTEISSTERRIRNYRRFATVQRASIKPEVVVKRTYVRNIPRSIRANSRTTTTAAPASTTPTTSRATTFPTRSYQHRFGTNRLRAARVTTPRSITTMANTTRAPTIQTPATTSRYVRHSDRETSTYGYTPDTTNSSTSSTVTGVASWESVRRNLQRYQVKRTTTETTNDIATEAPSTRATTTKTLRTITARSYTTSRPFSRTRNSNFKSQQIVARSTVSPRITKRRKSTTAIANSTTIPSKNYEQSNYINPFTLPTTSITHSYSNPSSSTSASTVERNLLNSDASLNSASDTLLSVSPTQTSSNFLSFDKLTQSIVDNSILQNFQPTNQFDSTSAASNTYGRRSLQSSSNGLSVNQVRSFGYEKQAAKAPSELTPPIRPQYLSQTPAIPTVQLPRVVIARAEGQRIEPNSVQSIISNLVEQPTHAAKSTLQAKASYVPLKDFLTSKFGVSNENSNKIPQETTTTQRTQIRQEKPVALIRQQPQQQQQKQLQYQLNGNFNYQQQQQQQQPLYQPQQQYQQQPLPQQQYQQLQPQLQPQQQYRQPQLQYQQQQIQPYQQQNLQYLQQQQRTQQLQQPQIFSSAYVPQHIEQQQEIPLGLAILNKLQLQTQQHQPPQQQQPLLQTQLQQPYNSQNVFVNYQQQPQFARSAPQQQQQSGNFVNYVKRIDSLNVPLPTLPNGLLPSISAQRRSDDDFEQLDLTDDISARSSVYDGASSYDVPLNSIGRLPNDKTQLRQRQVRFRRYY